MNTQMLGWFNRRVSNAFTVMIFAVLAFQYAFLQYKGLTSIDTFFEDIILWYVMGLAILYLFNYVKEQKEITDSWTRCGIFGFQSTYFLLSIAYVFCRLYIGRSDLLSQSEEDFLSVIFIAIMGFVIVIFISVIRDLFYEKFKNKVRNHLQIARIVCFSFVFRIYALYLFWRFFLGIEERNISFHLLLVYISSVFIYSMVTDYYKLRKKKVKTQIVKLGRWLIISFTIAFALSIIYGIINFLMRNL